MTEPETTSSLEPPLALEPAQEKTKSAAKKKGFLFKLYAFFTEDVDPNDLPEDNADFNLKMKKIRMKITRQSYVILVLSVVVVLLLPFAAPVSMYRAIKATQKKETMPLAPLMEPNLTKQAILSWVATAVTEILTFGFGDFDRRIFSQRDRFTDEGWDSFVKTIREQDMRNDFKMRQLVLTTVPSDVPVIVSEGLDEGGDRVWNVELPIIMTYTTNNNVRQTKNSLIRLTIARVPSKVNMAGMGIKSWR